MTEVTTVDARNSFSEIVNKAAFGKERIVLTRRGKAVAAVVPVEDLTKLEELEDQADVNEAIAALAEARRRGTLPWAKVKEELGIE
jgi:prevent-host-death family protein